jgi:hypothetical protein
MLFPITIGNISFLAPALLFGLIALPALWWLLRMTPPPPRREIFPAVRLLAGLPQEEETPARTPWWLLALRLLVATLMILALAHPVSSPGSRLGNRDGSVILVVDNGWASAPGWADRLTAMDALLVEAERQGRPARLVTTAAHVDGAPPVVGDLISARELRPIVRALLPKPWSTDRAVALAALEKLKNEGAADIFWIADGLEESSSDQTPSLSSGNFSLALQKIGPVKVLRGLPSELAQTLTIDRGLAKKTAADVTSVAGRLNFVVRRSAGLPPAGVTLVARDLEGQILDRQISQFAHGVDDARFTLDVPNDIRNRIARVEIVDETSAAAVFLLDERWRRRSVGLVSGQNIDSDQPLLSSHYYLQKALQPVADTRIGDIDKLLERTTSVLILADVGRIVGRDRNRLKSWIDGGGVLVRFAGPKLAESGDDFVPVKLRTGNRVLAGAMTWSTPLPLRTFEETSPFFGLPVPDDVLIRQQVLAEPSATLSDRTWARLKDGTPIVTAEKRGEGWLVLIHATANADWSDLPFSGLFIGMLERLINLAHGVTPAIEGSAELKALKHLDGFGRLQNPQGVAKTYAPKDRVAPGRPPGFYGSASAQQALNLGPSLDAPQAFAPLPQSIGDERLAQRPEFDFKPGLLSAAALLLVLDLFISLLMRGFVPGVSIRSWRTSVGSGPLVMLLVLGGLVLTGMFLNSASGQAQETDDEFAMAASLDTRLAYIITGDDSVDAMSLAGLTALTNVVGARTSVEGREPLGVDPEIDELVFFPLIYWPIIPAMTPLSDQALAKIDAFMKSGGTILFDTRDQQYAAIGSGPGGVTPERDRLRRLLRRLDVPPLMPIPQKHIMTRAFYLMQTWPGRWSGGQVWVERHNGGINDGVSGLVIGGHDWAAAWAKDSQGNPLAAVVPEGARQREMAYRFGVNLVMYALTGNYKADQVHVPALLERLGQ